ncbi:MAG: SRPBCC family protein [Pseudomonadota bacterium]
MAFLQNDIVIDCAPAVVWDAVRDVAALHTRLVPGLVSDTRIDGDARIVRFASGVTVRERIIDVDETARRLVWSIVGAPFDYHQGVLQVFEAEGGRSRVVWTTDLLPASLLEAVRPNMDRGMTIMKHTLEDSSKY